MAATLTPPPVLPNTPGLDHIFIFDQYPTWSSYYYNFGANFVSSVPTFCPIMTTDIVPIVGGLTTDYEEPHFGNPTYISSSSTPTDLRVVVPWC